MGNDITIQGKVRPLAPFDRSLEKSSLKGASRIYINRDSFIKLTASVDNGRRCIVSRVAQDKPNIVREATLWTMANKNISPNVILMSEAYREACGLELGDQITISMHDQNVVPDAETVTILPITTTDEAEAKFSIWKDIWLGPIMFSLAQAEHVFPGMKFECPAPGAKHTFMIASVDGRSDGVSRFTRQTSTKYHPASQESHSHENQVVDKINIADIPGFPKETSQLRDFFWRFNYKARYKHQYRSCGIVIHGGRDTGKSFILDRIAATGWGKVFRIKGTDKSTTVEEVFQLAHSHQPSIILIDGLQALIHKDRANSGAVILQLCHQLDQLTFNFQQTLQLPKVMVVATCFDYWNDVPEELQKPTRFALEIPLVTPNADGRLQILKHLDVPIRPEHRTDLLELLSQNTHAYNAGDLCNLICYAENISAMRLGPDRQEEPMDQDLTEGDFRIALRYVKPTAMSNIHLKPPTVHWDDIGGQQDVKEALDFMIKLTKTTRPDIRKMMRKPAKGLLFYGPPGCSKTLSAQAMATESGFNFFSVKGAELLTMWVGESERMLRNLFSRARNASPSIIFFDEIDSIGGQRINSGSQSHVSVNMLTTLLTELDGFETLSGVIILGATNRPEALDPALLRPGRFDRKIYIGLPDFEARKAIFQLNLKTTLTTEDVDLSELAKLSVGFSGAEIEQIVNEAVECVLRKALMKRDELAKVSMQDLVAAIRGMPKGVTPQMINQYQKWAEQFHKH